MARELNNPIKLLVLLLFIWMFSIIDVHMNRVRENRRKKRQRKNAFKRQKRNARKKERKLSTQAAAKVDSWCLGCDWCKCMQRECVSFTWNPVGAYFSHTLFGRGDWILKTSRKSDRDGVCFVNGAANHWCCVSMRCVNVVQPLNCNAHYGTRSAAAAAIRADCSACVLTQKVPCNEKKSETKRKTFAPTPASNNWDGDGWPSTACAYD